MHHGTANVTRSDTTSPFVVRFTPDIEIAKGGDGRTIHGIFVPWNTVARVADRFGPGGRGEFEQYDEAVQRAAFPEAIANPERVKFLGHHKRGVNPLGRAMTTRDDAAGLYGEVRASKTVAGDEVLELVNDGVLDSFSVGFTPITSRSIDGVFVRQHAHLNEVSIVTFPAYDGALVGGVRGQDLTLNPDGTPGPDVGEPSVEDGSGDRQVAPPARYGMTTQERIRALHLLGLEG